MFKKIKSIIFDLGNVIIDISTDKMLDKWSEILKLDKKDIKDKFSIDEIYFNYEKGLITTGQYKDHVSEMLGRQLTMDEFLSGWNSIFIGISEDVKDMLIKLKSKYKIYALTNTNIAHYKYWILEYKDIITYFDHIFLSFEINMRKPEKAIYEFVLAEINEKKRHTLFIDDIEENVKSAIDTGIDSFRASSKKEMFNELRKRKIISG